MKHGTYYEETKTEISINLKEVYELINQLDDVSSVDCTNSVLRLVDRASQALKSLAMVARYSGSINGVSLKVITDEQTIFDRRYNAN